jgi:hypothetical protein
MSVDVSGFPHHAYLEFGISTSTDTEQASRQFLQKTKSNCSTLNRATLPVFLASGADKLRRDAFLDFFEMRINKQSKRSSMIDSVMELTGK